MPVERFILFTLASPESMTQVIPGTVSEVSAIAEDKMILIAFLFPPLIMYFCSFRFMLECKIEISISGLLSDFVSSFCFRSS